MPTYEGYTVGTGKTYSTIAACETAKNADQVTADKQIDALLASEAFDEAVTVLGGTNDATRYFRIRADDGCEFDIATRTGARIVSSGITAGRTAVILRDAYARLGGSSGNSTGAIGIKLSGTGTTALQGVETRGSGASVLVSQICCYDFSSSGSSLIGFYNETAGTDFTTVNCSAINSVTTGSAKDADGFWRTGSGVITAYNCVALHMTGTDDAYGFFGCTVYNCYAGGMTGGGGVGNDQLAFNGSVGGDYNAADDSTTSGFTHNLQSKAAANQFVNAVAGSEDLHLKAGADLIDAGNDGYAVDYDMDGLISGARDDIGCDEYVPVAAGHPTSRRWGGIPGMALPGASWVPGAHG